MAEEKKISANLKIANNLRIVLLLIFVFWLGPELVRADTLGQGQQFFISSQYDIQSRNRVSATLRKVSDHAYFYIEDSYWSSVSQNMQNQLLSQVEALAVEFDGRIYPTETQFFGSERNPGISGDSKITILLSPLIQNAGGYYDTTNEYPKEKTEGSNEREMVYLNVGQLYDQKKIFGFLAHEFQHLISFNQKENLRNISDDTWLNELRSEYAVTLLGYNDDFAGSNLERRLRSFLDNPSEGLTEWKNIQADYGQIAVFGEYLAENWSPKVIADTLKNNLVGIPSLENSLAENGFKDSFADVFTDWLAADILNNSSQNPKFGYSRGGLKNFQVTPTKVLNNLSDSLTFVVSDLLKDWQGRWYDISQFAQGENNFLKINFSSPSITSFKIPYILVKNNGSVELSVFNPTESASTLYIGEIAKDISRLIILPIKKDKISGFTSNETAVTLTFSVDRIKTLPQDAVLFSPAPIVSLTVLQIKPEPKPIQEITDGSLVRVAGDFRVYVTKKDWRRHIISPKIFSFYPSFGFNKVKEADFSFLDHYRESNLIRYNSSRRVYSIDESGKKHWLNISGRQFELSGRSWDSVFTVNLAEFNFYKTGKDLTK